VTQQLLNSMMNSPDQINVQGWRLNRNRKSRSSTGLIALKQGRSSNQLPLEIAEGEQLL
jgi:hypothetical protein